MFFPSAKVIIKHPTKHNTILLIKRQIHGQVFYEPAGGKAEINFEKKKAENLEECAIREIQEELGLNIKIEEYVGSYYFFWTIDPTKCSLCAVFVGTIINKIENYSGNPDTCEISFEQTWVTLQDITHNKVKIDEHFVGLKKIILNCFM